MAVKALPTPEVLRQLLRYEPETGVLTWLERHLEVFCDTDGRTAEHSCANWNAIWAGKTALCNIDSKGYYRGSILGTGHRTHRVVWAIHHGHWPEDQIDHINGIRTDNRIANLRVASNTQNSRNASRGVNNSSGVTGVCWHSSADKWMAQITFNRRNIYLGLFEALDEAVAVRKAAEKHLGFAEGHGRSSKWTPSKKSGPGCCAL